MSDFNRRPRKDCPCKPDCKKRSAECHGNCPEYEQWRKKLDSDNDKEREFQKKYNTISETNVRKIWRNQRYDKRKRG